MRMTEVPRIPDLIADEIHDDGLRRHIQTRRRLVGDQQFRCEQASAMAIITRWHSPPESSNG